MISNGIDLGDRSLAVVSVELDNDGIPLKLRAQSLLLHDGGVIDEQYKVSRIAKRGNARRTRRRFARRRKRPAELRAVLAKEGFPTPATDELPPHASDEVRSTLKGSSVENRLQDGQFPWFARRALLTKIDDDAQAKLLFSVAALHIDRHRGWRNPWINVDSMIRSMRGDDGKFELSSNANRWFKAAGTRFEADVRSYGECGALAVDHGQAIRLNNRVKERLGQDTSKVHNAIKRSKGPDDLVPMLHEFAVPVRPFQQDLAYELFLLGEIQGFNSDSIERIVKAVFDQEKPGFSRDVIGDCPLVVGEKRAPSYLPSVQEWKIRGFVANLRATEASGEKRRLTVEEQDHIVKKLSAEKERNKVRWGSLEEWLLELHGYEVELNRNKREGRSETGSVDEDEGSVETSRHPIIDASNALIEKGGNDWKTFRNWWRTASVEERELLLRSLDAATHDTEDERDPATVFRDTLLEDEAFDSEDFETFVEKIPDGRIAYSATAIAEMLPFMRKGADLYEARKEAFGLDEKWAPPGPTWDKPGMKNHPVLQVVQSALNKSLGAIDREIGVADFVRVEAARKSMTLMDKKRALSGFAKESEARNICARENISEVEGKASRGRVRTARIIADQNNQCAYELACSGTTLSLDNTELDHIVPRTEGAGNPRKNMVACCADCNRKKGGRAYGGIVDSETLEQTINRMRSWKLEAFSPDLPRDMEKMLRAKSASDVDLRSPTPTSQVATQICNMLTDRYSRVGDNETICESVNAAVGAEARKTVKWKKNRTDHRHHVVDAAVVACINPKVIPFLRERQAMRDYAYNFRKGSPKYEELMGAAKDYGMKHDYFNRWVAGLTSIINELGELFERDNDPWTANNDEGDPIKELDALVPRRPIRLKAVSKRADGIVVASDPLHLETGNKIQFHCVGASWTSDEIDRVGDRDLYVTLKRMSLDHGGELPNDPARTLTTSAHELEASALVPQTPGATQVLVRGAAYEIGSVHHLRVYEYKRKGKPVRAFIPVYHFDAVQAVLDCDPALPDRRPTHVALHLGSISFRAGKGKAARELHEALLQSAPVDLVGWIAPGDEILADTTEVVAWYPREKTPATWKRQRRTYCTGIEVRNSRLTLKPLVEAWPEGGIPEEGIPLSGATIRGLLTYGKLNEVTVIRRDPLGRIKEAWRPLEP